MKNLKLNKLSKQQMSQITGGERDINTRIINGKQAKVSSEHTWAISGGQLVATSEVIRCVCGCVYANQGGSSTDANFTANDARNLKSF